MLKFIFNHLEMRSFPGVTVTREIKNIAGNLDKLGIVDFFFLALDESKHVIWTQPSYSSLQSHYTTSKITKVLFTKSKVSLFFSFVQYFSRCAIFITFPPLFIYYLLYSSVHSVYVFLSSSFVYCLLFSHPVVLLHHLMVQATIQ